MGTSDRAKEAGFEKDNAYLKTIVSDSKYNILMRQVPDPLFERPADHDYDILTLRRNDASYMGAKVFRFRGQTLHKAFLNQTKIDLRSLQPVRTDVGVMSYLTDLALREKERRVYRMIAQEFGQDR